MLIINSSSIKIKWVFYNIIYVCTLLKKYANKMKLFWIIIIKSTLTNWCCCWINIAKWQRIFKSYSYVASNWNSISDETVKNNFLKQLNMIKKKLSLMVKKYVAEIKHTFRFYQNTPFIIGVVSIVILT